MNNNSVSVVTICLNAENEIEKTIKSVLELTGNQIEYIVKDGGSSDKTLEIANKYKFEFEKKSIKYTVVSKKDRGIYDAMNQAIQYCQNEWTIFMNAGDTFYNSEVIQDVFYRQIGSEVGIVYGHADYLLTGNYNMIIKSNLELTNKSAICHQAIFARTALIKKHKFDCSYKVAADRDMVFKILSEGIRAQNVNVVICKYQRGGISSLDYITLKKEIYECNERYGVLPNQYRGWLAYIKKYINKFCPVFADISLCKKSMKK